MAKKKKTGYNANEMLHTVVLAFAVSSHVPTHDLVQFSAKNCTS